MGQTVKLGAGCVIVLILLLLKVLGKLKVPSRVTVFTMAFVLSYLLAPILDDMMLLSGAALVGEAIDSMFFSRLIEKTKEQIRIEENATATADKVEVVLKTYLGGRV
jgi:type III secretory pathway component EscR